MEFSSWRSAGGATLEGSACRRTRKIIALARILVWLACDATCQYDGETNVAPDTLVPDASNDDQPDGISVVGWGSLEPAFGAWSFAWYAMSGTQRVLVDADILLSDTTVKTLDTIDRLMTHEWGPALGLAHSNLENAAMVGKSWVAHSDGADLVTMCTP